MKSLKLYTGNRLELLAQLLARVLEGPLASPLEPEIIVVQSKGMERWLAMQLAAHFGVCANCRFPFPNAFLQEIFQRVLPDSPESPLFNPEFAAWRLMQLLPAHLDEPEFAILKHYLNRVPRNLRRLQLASHLARTFDQYVLYRPELITRWEQGDEDHWQAVLWREFARGLEKQHRAALGRAFLEQIRQLDRESCPLPRRVSLFGISYLPPFHLHMLDGLAHLTEVNLFLLSPCREYWGDITPERTIGKVMARQRSDRQSPAELHLEQGNPLLASLGALGRDFLGLLAALDCQETSVFQEPGENSLLTCLQSDLLNLRDRTEGSREKTVIPPDDHSFQFHSCHSPMREVEVLYDHLLELFDQDPTLRPGDVLVMAPAIETYAPFIQAVFDAPEDDRKRIPYSIADRSMRKESQVAEAFLAMLELWDERITAAKVLGLLEAGAVRARFGLTEADQDLIAGWLREVRIRWGIDEEDRLRWNSQAFRDNTWRAGLERLLLGYAMPGDNRQLFCGILPYDHIEGREVAVLGGLIEFAEQLFALVASLSHPRTLHQWSETLIEALTRFFLPDDDGLREFQAVRQVLLDLATIQEMSRFAEPVEIRVIKWHLDRRLEREGFGFGFLTGGVTCCSMLPMRSIPMRVVWLLGMDGNAFPRQAKALDFDLIAKNPRAGDRSSRNDDRYLFLEALISAREQLSVSYTGQSLRDNSSIPPSVLVSELLDYIHRAFTVPVRGRSEAGPGSTARDDAAAGSDEATAAPFAEAADDPERLIVKHRLQPFSPAYFKGDRRLFTYSEEWQETARCLLREQTLPPPFLATPLEPPEEALKRIDLHRLGRFFANPARFFLDRRLGITLDEDPALPDETECFQLAGLDRYDLGQTLLAARMAGHDRSALSRSLRASGVLPHGVPGDLSFKAMSDGVEEFARRLEPFVGEKELDSLVFELPLADFVLTGTITSLFPERLVRYRYAALKAKDYLNLWLPHLVLNLLSRPGYPRESLLAGLRDSEWCTVTFGPVEQCREHLEFLLRIYWSGLCRPLPFFPESSFRYAEQLIVRDAPPEKALARARGAWTGSDFHRGESRDLSYQLCFKGVEPLAGDFESLAAAVFGPLLAARTGS